jgi:carbamoyltransferase
MIVLGLHFGHDAAVALVRDGEVIAFLEKERKNRVKHALGLDFSDVSDVLEEAGLSSRDVDSCAVTSTQDVEYYFFAPEQLSFILGGAAVREIPSPLWRQRYGEAETPGPIEGQRRLAQVYSQPGDHRYKHFFRQYGHYDLATLASAPSVEDFACHELWADRKSLAEIGVCDYRPLLNDDFARSFHLPITLTLAGRRVPGALFSHHYAHAAYAFYESPYRRAAILSHDGGSARRGYRAGLFFHGDGERLYPLAPHRLAGGWTYHVVGRDIGFGSIGGSGKLMGLSAYGRPACFDPTFVGNWPAGPRAGEAKHPDRWFAQMVDSARGQGYDMSALGDRARMTEAVNADLAASTQKLFEETMLCAVESLRQACEVAGLPAEGLVLSGGAALNCPANTRILASGIFDGLFVPPGCDDSGLAIGAAQALCHAVLGVPRGAPSQPSSHRACLGIRLCGEELDEVLRAHAEALIVEHPEDPVGEAARLLHGDRVIAWFEGRSEIGPRALGHRSILAHPGNVTNWCRVNRIKEREAWRPLAPSILVEACAEWCAGAPIPSPYMLFNAGMRRPDAPAVTHVDNSARIQTVAAHDGNYYRLLVEFHALSGLPLLLNTSFNGPAMPIIERPSEAVRFFLGSELDHLFIDGVKVSRRPAGQGSS